MSTQQAFLLKKDIDHCSPAVLCRNSLLWDDPQLRVVSCVLLIILNRCCFRFGQSRIVASWPLAHLRVWNMNPEWGMQVNGCDSEEWMLFSGTDSELGFSRFSPWSGAQPQSLQFRFPLLLRLAHHFVFPVGEPPCGPMISVCHSGGELSGFSLPSSCCHHSGSCLIHLSFYQEVIYKRTSLI